MCRRGVAPASTCRFTTGQKNGVKSWLTPSFQFSHDGRSRLFSNPGPRERRERGLLLVCHREDVRQLGRHRRERLETLRLRDLDLDVLVAVHTRTGRNEVTDD